MASGERLASTEPIDPKKVLKQMVELIGSESFRNVFAQLSGKDRLNVFSSLLASGEDLEKLHRRLADQEEREKRKRLGLDFYHGEVSHPEMIITRVFRVGGYVDLSRMQDPNLVSRLPERILRSVELCRQHIERFGKESIAHLCLDSPLFFDLTDGLQSGYDSQNLGVIRVDTIENLRTFLVMLSSDESLRLIRTNSF